MSLPPPSLGAARPWLEDLRLYNGNPEAAAPSDDDIWLVSEELLSAEKAIIARLDPKPPPP